MTWRAFVLAAMMLAMLVMSVGLMVQEGTPRLATEEQAIREVDPILGDLLYTAASRTDDFRLLGWSTEQAGQIRDKAGRVHDDYRSRFEAILEEQQTVLSGYVCLGRDIPPRFSGMGFLVEETGQAGTKERRMVRWSSASEFELQDWYSTQVEVVREAYRVGVKRNTKPDASLMTMAALMGMRVDDLLEGNRPFSLGSIGGWSLSRVFENDPTLEGKLKEYTAVIHVLVEIANDPERGFCGEG